MPKQIDISSYECDCGHQLHFCVSTIWEAEKMSLKKKIRLGDSDDPHCVVFEKGEWVGIICPKDKPNL